MVVGLITAVPDRASIEQTVNTLAAGLGAADYFDREDAEQALKNLIGGYLIQGDFTRATLVVNQVAQIAQTSPEQEIRNRAWEIVAFAEKASRYLPEKQAIIQAINGGI